MNWRFLRFEKSSASHETLVPLLFIQVKRKSAIFHINLSVMVKQKNLKSKHSFLIYSCIEGSWFWLPWKVHLKSGTEQRGWLSYMHNQRKTANKYKNNYDDKYHHKYELNSKSICKTTRPDINQTLDVRGIRSIHKIVEYKQNT